VFADGNGGDLRSGAGWASWFRELGCAALCYEYPGYGDSDGTPSVASFELAARAAADAARRRRPDLPLAAAGLSLGTFSAVQLAAEQRVTRLLLLAPPTSLLASASEHYRWLPVRWLLRHRFDSLVRAPQIACPTLIAHGLDDRVVPAAHGRELAAAIGPHARFLGLPGHGHDDLPLEPHGRLAAEIASFLGGG
jgi:pimeloyl-ACP methyl ester carboxylesterase